MGPRAAAARLAATALGALGVVYGDIGTSPLYALKECFSGRRTAWPPTRGNVLGVLSLIFWSLIFVVVVKYLDFIMRADNRGRGRHPRAARAGAAAAARRGGARGVAGRRSACSARRCSTATASSRPPSRCSARSRASSVADAAASRRGVVPIIGCDPGRPLPRPAARHGRRRARCSARSWWSGSSSHRACSACARDRAPTRRCCAAVNPVHAVRFFLRRRLARLPRARRGRPRA